jgi:hypothetical protein
MNHGDLPNRVSTALVRQNGCGIVGNHSPSGGESHGTEYERTRLRLATLVFHVVGMGNTGHVVLRKHMARSKLQPFMADLPPLRMGMEACGSAHD